MQVITTHDGHMFPEYVGTLLGFPCTIGDLGNPIADEVAARLECFDARGISDLGVIIEQVADLDPGRHIMISRGLYAAIRAQAMRWVTTDDKDTG